MDNEYWVSLFGTNPNNNPTWDINDPITMEEVQNTVLDMNNNKAPGPDGIPIEFFKAFFCKSDLSDNQNDSSDDHYSLSVLNVYFHYLTKSGMVISLKNGIRLL